MPNGGGDDISQVLLNGITFRGCPKKDKTAQPAGVKTKAKKKSYITGAHGSGSAKMKAEIRRKRANRR